MKKNGLRVGNTFTIEKYLSPFVLNSDELFDVDGLYQTCMSNTLYPENAPPLSNETLTKVKRTKDIYKPQLIRGYGQDREGHCAECDQWFRLKTSSYWYHMNYKHGINSQGLRYPEPEVRINNCKVEGFCQACRKWIVLGNKSNKKSIKFGWYKHCQKNHVGNGTL